MRATRIGLATLGLAAAAPALAQEVRTDIRFGTAIDYESNLLRANRLRGDFDGSDTRVTPSVDVDIARRIGRDGVSLKGTAGYDFYRRNSYLDRERIRLDARGDFGIGAFCGVDLSAGIDFQQTDIAELGERIGNTSRVRRYGGTADCTRRAGLTPRVAVSREIVDNSQDFRRRFDLRGYDLRGGVAYSRPSLGVVGVFYGLERVAHPNRPLSDGMIGDRTTVRQAGIEIERAVAPRLSADVRLMYIRARTRGGQARPFSGMGWTTDVRWLPGSRATLTATLDRGVRGQSSFDASYAISTRTNLAVDYRIGHLTGVSLSVFQEHRSIRGEDPLSGLPPRGSDDSWVIGAGAHYDPYKSLRLQVGATYRKRDSRNDFYDYSSTGARVSARLRF